ncbi:hypothetical protein CLCR_04830 [Cladophialophora carrionii]|uniref:Uncharacterized protein n=1 Tax=Cladophialophora carrionii TaxID=86049 RepID=A0A1C1CJM1_9EURO|nr:hypothetical protein CLCR_04830 [Cladophialophora carrionii]
MPFPSLRRRTVDEPLPSQQENRTPPPYRARSTTISGLSPRKSLQSALGSVRKKTSPSKPDILEEEVYLPSDHVQSRAGWTPFRTPSPHPAKASLNTSQLRLTKSEPPRTFLETLANAIRAPAALFYKDKRDKTSEDSAPLVSDEVDSDVNPPSPTKTLSSNKSVRFQPGQSTIEDEPRAVPIDIPNSTPALPPMQLATTPLLQCFVRDHREMIPSGRPRSPAVLDSTLKFRQAMAEAQEYMENNLLAIPPLGSPVPDIASPLAASHQLENPFEDPKGEQLLASNEKVDDASETTSVNTGMATASSNSTAEIDKYDVFPDLAGETNLCDILRVMQRKQSDNVTELPSNTAFLDQRPDDSKDPCGQNICPRHSFTRNRRIDEKWMEKPSHENIRERFKHSGRFDDSSPSRTNPFSDDNGYVHQNVCANTTIAPSTSDIAEMSHVQSPGTAPLEQSVASADKKENCFKPTPEAVSRVHIYRRGRILTQ